MIEILASSIIIHGNAGGIWSPSHPHLYPRPEIPFVHIPPMNHQQPYVVPPVVNLEYDQQNQNYVSGDQTGNFGTP